MNGNKKPNKVSEEANIVSWVLTGLLLAVDAFPLGLFFLIAKLSGRDILGRLFMALQEGFRNNATPDSKRSSTHRTGENYTPNSSSRSRVVQQQGAQAASSGPVESVAAVRPQQTQQTAAQQPQSAPGKNPEKTKDDGIQHISRGKKALFICGWILLAAGVLLSINSIAAGATLWRVMQWIAVALSGGGMLFTSHIKDKKERLYQNIVRIVGDKAYIDLKSLASAAGVKEKNLIREVDEMLERRYLPESAYLDNARNLLVMDPENVPEFAEAAAEASDPDREEDKYDLLLKEMERSCGRIRDRDMLEKAVQIRGLAAAIFSAVRQAPEKQPQISSFMNYYFPTTLKLLDSYADFEEKGYQGEKLTQTKERIETTMDTIISAYRKQLDILYLSDTMDIDTDIDVLETMLKKDGLSESDFSQSMQEGTPGTGTMS